LRLTSDGLGDLVPHVLLCVVSVTAGSGLVRLARVPLGRCATLLIAPVVTLAFWAIVLGAAVAEGLPVQRFGIPLWIATGALAVYGFVTVVARTHDAADADGRAAPAFALLALSAVLPIILLFPDSFSGLSGFGGYGNDGWSSIAYGQYLSHYPQGTDGGLSPIYQWAAHLSGTRHVSSAEMAFLAMVASDGATQAADGLFVTITFFTIGAACGAFAYRWGVPLAAALLYVGVTVLSGWMLTVVQADNYDFALSLAYLPAVAALARDSRPLSLSQWGLIAALSAGLFYIYPELVPIVLACAALLLVDRLWREPLPAVKGVLAAIVSFLALTAPYLRTGTWYFYQQATGALRQTTGPRPGEYYFPGMLVPHQRMASFWSLGSEFGAQTWMAGRQLIGAALFLLLAAGAVRLVRRREWGLLAATSVLLSGGVVFLAYHAYAYGAYKFIGLVWWALTFAVVLGAASPALWRRSTAVRAVACGLAVVVVLALPAAAAERLVRNADALRATRNISYFRRVEQARWMAGTQPIGVYLKDALSSYWALYFLRDGPIRLLDTPGYLGAPHVQTLLSRAPDIPLGSIRFMLTDDVDLGPVVEDQGWTLVWHAGPYKLWDTRGRGWAIVPGLGAPAGAEALGDGFRIGGHEPTHFTIVASRPGTAKLVAQFEPWPTLSSDDTDARVRVASTGVDRVETIAPGRQTICLPVTQGSAIWALTPLDPVGAPAGQRPEPTPRTISVRRPVIQWEPVPMNAVDGCPTR
jgi:hypothetical protein